MKFHVWWLCMVFGFLATYGSVLAGDRHYGEVHFTSSDPTIKCNNCGRRPKAGEDWYCTDFSTWRTYYCPACGHAAFHIEQEGWYGAERHLPQLSEVGADSVLAKSVDGSERTSLIDDTAQFAGDHADSLLLYPIITNASISVEFYKEWLTSGNLVEFWNTDASLLSSGRLYAIMAQNAFRELLVTNRDVLGKLQDHEAIGSVIDRLVEWPDNWAPQDVERSSEDIRQLAVKSAVWLTIVEMKLQHAAIGAAHSK